MPPVTAAGRPAFPPMKEPPLMPTITDNAVKMNTATVGTHISGRMRPAMDIDIPTARASMLTATPASTMLRKPVRLWGSSSEKASLIIDEPTNISRAIPTYLTILMMYLEMKSPKAQPAARNDVWMTAKINAIRRTSVQRTFFIDTLAQRATAKQSAQREAERSISLNIDYRGLKICLFTIERPRVSWSAYSSPSPKPSPLAREEILTPNGEICLYM